MTADGHKVPQLLVDGKKQHMLERNRFAGITIEFIKLDQKDKLAMAQIYTISEI